MFKYGKSMPILLITILLFYGNLFAQQAKIKISLEEALTKARENNYEIKLAESEENAMRADFNSSLSVFLPQITLSETFVRTNDPLNTFGLKLKQEIVSQMDFNPALLNDPDAIKNFNTKLEVKQPLINLDGFWGRAAAADGLSALEFKRKRTENYMDFMVKMNYYQVGLMSKSLNVVNKSLETAKANRKLIKDYYDEGMITKADYLMAEVFVSNLESQKTDVESQYKNANNNLKHLMGIDDNTEFEPIDTLSFSKVSDIKFSTSSVLASRSDLMAYTYKVDAMSKKHTMNWMKFLPRLNAFGSFEYNDTKVFGTNADNWMVGLNLQWNVFNGFQNIASIQKSKAELNHAKIELAKAKSQSKNEIDAAINDLETASRKLNLAETSVKQSEESLRIIKDRYEKGLEKTTDLLNAETAASGARLNYLKTLFFYNVSLFKVELMIEEKIISE
ncbi:MAG: TolC family protein [Ignavibacteriae bacterium]|nr:TolC family protein [Ignavibacteriota bacterium]NOG99311.1 TolC family protein [Ignavibacteriota bacterium]